MVSAACHSKSIKTGLEGWSKETGEGSDSRSKRRAEETVKEKKKKDGGGEKQMKFKKETFQGGGPSSRPTARCDVNSWRVKKETLSSRHTLTSQSAPSVESFSAGV